MTRRIVVKIGSSSIVNSNLSINKQVMISLMKSFALLKEKGIEVALVSSGAIATGMHELNLKKKPSMMSLKQACAAVGQAKLMEEYNKSAAYYDLLTGQILVSHDDFQVRKRMVFLSNTLDEMFKNGIIPIINENDALAVEEIKVGDNDTLASLIAPMIHADLVILFSDVDGLYDKNPKTEKDAKLISDIYDINEVIDFGKGSNSSVGTGGMQTKIQSAIMASSIGCDLIICNSKYIDKLVDICLGEKIGSYFHRQEKTISSREHWIIYKTNSLGALIVDEGCKKILETPDKKVSILAKGILRVDGSFLKDAVIDIRSEDGKVLGKGISKYNSNEIDKIKGLDSKTINELGYKYSYAIHANDVVLFKK